MAPWTVLLAMQNAATAACDRIGLTHEALLREHGVIFLAVAQAVRFSRPLTAGKELRVRTDPIRLRGPYFLRQTLFTDENGTAAEGQAAWVLADAVTGAPKRSTMLRDLFDVAEDARPFVDASRLRYPTASAPWGHYDVAQADTDLNGHMNNTVYARLLMNCLPQEGPVEEFGIRYRRQCFPGDRLTLCREGEYAAGYLGDDLCFDGYVRSARQRSE